GTVLRDGTDLAICACGVEVPEALDAAELLFAKGIDARVINLSTVDPMDEELVATAARECGAILTVEEHQIRGGLGDAVAQAVVKHCPVPMGMVGMDGEFGQSGPPNDLLAHYGLDAKGIAARAEELLQRKG
ncbi:MAG: transketolase C-terminal domain-containing protein, partial [bacterium]